MFGLKFVLNFISSAEDELGEGITNVFTEWLVGFVLKLINGVSNVVVDLDSVDDEISSNMISETSWTGEDGSHLLKLGPVSGDTFTVVNLILNAHDSVSKMLKTIKSSRGSILLEVIDSNLNIIDDLDGVIDAILNVVKTLGFDGSNEDSSGDVKGFLESWCDFLLANHLSLSCKFTKRDLSQGDSDVGSKSSVVLGSKVSGSFGDVR